MKKVFDIVVAFFLEKSYKSLPKRFLLVSYIYSNIEPELGAGYSTYGTNALILAGNSSNLDWYHLLVAQLRPAR